MNWLVELLIWLKSLLSAKPSLAPVVTLPQSEDPPWLVIARKEIGVKEFIPGDNPQIIKYHQSTWLKATEDSVAWCAAFVSHCLEASGIKSQRSPRAKDYLLYGDKLEKPKLGCICVFSRDGGGHVGFWLGETADSIKLLGGNQGNAVSISFYSKVNLLGYRWPKNV
jgi:uncharacterized protein (TIGR02594 family)